MRFKRAHVLAYAQVELISSFDAMPDDWADPESDTNLSFDLVFDFALFGAPVNPQRPPDAPQPFRQGPGAAAAVDAVLLLKLLQANPQ